MIEFDPFSEAYFDDPFRIYKQLRDEAPCLYMEQYDTFFLSRFEDIWDAVSNPLMSHRRGTTSMELLLGQPRHEVALSSMVPPAHTELRRALAPHFMPGAVRRLEPRAREFTEQIFDEAMERDGADANTELGRRLSARVAFMILGLPLEDAEMAGDKVTATFDREEGVQGDTDTAQDARGDLNQYLASMLEERRRKPQAGGLVEDLLAFRFEGEPLPDSQILSNLFLLVVGGTETLPKVFAGMAYQLFLHPDQRAELAADPSLTKAAFWEGLRYEMPTLMLGASAEAETEICGGVKVREGQKLMHLWVSANRDEREFPDPDRFDIHRNAPRILTFNHTRHRCLGANVAQMEGRLLVDELLRRAPDYWVDEEKIERIRSEFFRGYANMPLRLRG
jgi:cytochrome P450